MTQWNFDPTHSEIAFKVRHMMFSKVTGFFRSWDGEFHFDPETPENAKTTVHIDTTSIDTATADRDNHLRSGDFFDAENHPHLIFESTNFEGAGEGKMKVDGELTIRDVTRPVSLDVEFHGTGIDPWGNERVGFSASTSINRKDFGLTWNQALEAGGVLVGDKVEIEIEVQAVKAE